MTKKEIIELLKIENFSSEYYDLLKKANIMTRKEFNNRGYIFAQMGINGGKCEGNCKFCSMARKYYALEKEYELSLEEIVSKAKKLADEKVDDIFLMTTVGYSMEKFLRAGEEVKKVIPDDVRLVCNTKDFDFTVAKELKSAGYTGAYHIRRLREGIDTDIPVKTREKTIQSIIDSGMELYYCIEPIGPEHTYEEIADEICYAQSLNIGAMAVMRRVAVKGTVLYDRGQISKSELIKIGAVTRIATRPTRSMNVHETVESSLLCGVNQLYAETGSNPRDDVLDTSTGRGLNIRQVKELFDEYGLKYRK